MPETKTAQELFQQDAQAKEHLKALGIKIEDFDKEKLKTDGKYCFYLLEKVLNRTSEKDFEDVINYFVELGYFNILESKQEFSMEEKAIDWYNESPLSEDVLKGLTTQYSFQMLKNALEIKNTELREKVMGYLIAQGVDIDCEVENGQGNKVTLLGNVNRYKYEEVKSLLKLGAIKGFDEALENILKDPYNHYQNARSTIDSKSVALINLLLVHYNKIIDNRLLSKVIKFKDVRLIKALVKDNPNITQLKYGSGDTLLSLAIQNNCDNEILKELLSNGADPYLGNGLTLLKSLAQDDSSDLERAKILVEALEEVARCDASKKSELKSVIETKSTTESKTLLERVLSKGKYRDYIAKVLILAGARTGIDTKDNQSKDIFDRSFNNNFLSEWWSGDTFTNPLIDSAIKERDLLIIERLLKHERTRDLIIKKATEGKNTFTIEQLLQNQETKKLVEKEVLSSSDLVIKMIKDQSDNNNQFLALLIASKILHANAKIDGKPLLQLACKADNLPAAKLLINLGADISAKIEHDYTSLDYVLQERKEELFELFINTIESYEKSKKVELLSSAMLHVVHNQKKEVFNQWRQLLQYGASVTYQNSDGDNLMHIAQKAGRGDLVLDMLLQHQLPNATCKDLVSALSTKNKEGKTPIDIINNKPQLSSYKSYFEEYKGRKSREVLYKGLGGTTIITLMVGAVAFLSLIALYAAAAVVSIGIACTAYKVYSVGKSVKEETRDVYENINSRLSELNTSEFNSQVSSAQVA